jgi:hypothetical protein
VPDWGKPLGNDGGNGDGQPGIDADGILLQTQRTSFDRYHQRTGKQENRIVEVIPRLLGFSSNPNKEKGMERKSW